MGEGATSSALAGLFRASLSLSQKPALVMGTAFGAPKRRHQPGGCRDALRPTGREQMWVVPPTLDELLPLINRRGSSLSSLMRWTGASGQSLA